jgi:hypothetical protein
MAQQTYEDAVRKLAADIAELCIQKHRDYGTGNLINTPFSPRTVIAVRLYEKVARMANLVETHKEAQNESLFDTYQDIIGYTMAALMIEEGTFTLPMESV